MEYVTPEVRAMVGLSGPKLTASHPLGADELRRFVQGAMESNPIHMNDAAASEAGFGGLVATPLFPVHSLRRPPGSPDPFERLQSVPDWDGLEPGGGLVGLAPVPVPLTRLLNGGVAAEFHQLAKVGDVISAQGRYVDISEREGRSGSMVLVTVETTYTNQDDDVLVRVRSTIIMR
jgi:acyl dehydratase